jgi:hypothetical protein
MTVQLKVPKGYYSRLLAPFQAALELVAVVEQFDVGLELRQLCASQFVKKMIPMLEQSAGRVK